MSVNMLMVFEIMYFTFILVYFLFTRIDRKCLFTWP